MDIAVVVNLHARRGSAAVAEAFERTVPGARVLASRSSGETADFAESLRSAPPDLLVAAGGDGTAVNLLNAMRAAAGAASLGASAAGGAGPTVRREPLLGVMPLGTGNAWAHSVGAPGWKAALRMLGRAAEAEHLLPRRRFDLVSVLGVEAPFAGAGWDSYILEDYHKSRDAWSLVPRALRTGPVGYLYSTATRTLPRQVFEKPVEVELVNLGEPALRIDAAGRAVPMEGQSGVAGAVLYRGPVGVCGAATTQEYGFRFRAYPHAGLVDGRFCTRIYSGTPMDATMNLPDIWRGAHPIRHMHDFLVTRCKMVFDRDVPFQVGGDRIGWRREVEYGIAERPIDLLDWSALRAGPIGRQ